MTANEKLNFLAGEVNGLRAFAFALANSHPNPAALLQELVRLGETALALSNPVPVSEQYLEGLQQTIDELKNHLQVRTKGV